MGRRLDEGDGRSGSYVEVFVAVQHCCCDADNFRDGEGFFGLMILEVLVHVNRPCRTGPVGTLDRTSGVHTEKVVYIVMARKGWGRVGLGLNFLFKGTPPIS